MERATSRDWTGLSERTREREIRMQMLNVCSIIIRVRYESCPVRYAGGVYVYGLVIDRRYRSVRNYGTK